MSGQYYLQLVGQKPGTLLNTVQSMGQALKAQDDLADYANNVEVEQASSNPSALVTMKFFSP